MLAPFRSPPTHPPREKKKDDRVLCTTYWASPSHTAQRRCDRSARGGTTTHHVPPKRSQTVPNGQAFRTVWDRSVVTSLVGTLGMTNLPGNHQVTRDSYSFKFVIPLKVCVHRNVVK